MAEETKVGEVEKTTATIKEITLDEVLANKEIMESILKSDVVAKLIQGEVDKVRTKASQEGKEKESEFAKYKSETDLKIAELTAFQKNYFRTEVLRKSGLETDLWDYVKGDTEEEIKKSANELKKLIAKKAEEVVGSKTQTGTSYVGLTKEQFGKMTYAEKAELYQKDKETYEKLMRGE